MSYPAGPASTTSCFTVEKEWRKTMFKAIWEFVKLLAGKSDNFCYHCQIWKDCCMHEHPEVPTYYLWICCMCGKKRPDVF
jgi:hypothetical protein